MDRSSYYTLAEGCPSANPGASTQLRSRLGGGLGLLQDTQLIETLAHFSRERIPERVVHAKGAGAYGEFEATADCSDITSASFLSKAGKKTPLLLRISTVGPQGGAADTVRDVRGWAMKLYTDEGNLDWVFNDTPVFFIRDPTKFPSMNRSHKRNPRTHRHDANMFWDFHVGNPEGIHQLLQLFSDRGIPKSLRHINAFSGHTYKFTKADGSFKYVKIHIKTTLGAEGMTHEEAAKIAGEDPDSQLQDLYEAIEKGDYPIWNVYVQVMDPAEAERYRWNIFDMTKVWPHSDYPLRQIGRITLNRNPNNYFTDIEQAAFSPSTMVPGFAPSADPVLQARLFAYPDAARYRIGVNYQQLPTNASKAPVYCPFERDGAMRFDDNYGEDPNYVGSSIKPTKLYQDVIGDKMQSLTLITEHEKWVGEVCSFESQITDDDFVQPAALWDVIGRYPGQQDRLIGNVASSLKSVTYPGLRHKAYDLFSRVNEGLGKRIKQATEMGGVDRARFDFIVVGGGTAGNAVAGRLAENPDVSVLVVEAGAGNPDQLEEITTPSNAMELRNSKHDWAYKSTIVKRDDYERVEKPNSRGKVLGGSSSLNYFTWVPGCKGTFDQWEDYGGKEWTWDPLVPYFRKSVTYHDDAKRYPDDLHKIGAGGPVHISHAELLDEMKPFREAIMKAWKAKGGVITENIYDGEMNGLVHCCDTIYQGERTGSWLFLRGRPNVTVLSGVNSKRLIIDETKTCKGVTVIHPSGNESDYFAAREVILSQGVFETPKLLMLSGIGPSRELDRHNIKTVVDSSHVGKNLVDHPGVPFVLRLKDGYGMDSIILRKGPKNDAMQAAYKKDRSGPAGSGLLELVGFPRIDGYLEKDEAYRNAKAANGGRDVFSPQGQPHFELDFVCMFGQAFQWHYPTPREGDHLTVVVDLVRPISDPGEVTLRSADPLEQPDINLNFFSNELDIIAMREGIRFAYDVLRGPDFKHLILAEYPWEMPLESDEGMRLAVLERCQTAFHPCGTARLSKHIGQGVVDPKLNVHNVAGLRVADASVMPVIPDCRIQNAVYMVAEKCADLVKADHRDLFR